MVVPSLSLPPDGSGLAEVAAAEAVRLFVERAREAGGGFALTDANTAAVARLVRRLDGIPLALELAAARVRSLSPAELAERLDERFRLLGAGRRTAVERHQTLRRAIDWSYELLTGREQTALNRASVFAGDFGLDAAEAVLSGGMIEPFEVIELLGYLVDKSLVVAEDRDGTTRYRLLETIRQYAQERLEASGEAAELRPRHAEYYAGFVAQVGAGLRGRDEVAWTQRFDLELDNLRASVSWAVAMEVADLGLRLVAPLTLNGTRAAYAAHAWASSVAAVPGSAVHPLYPEVLAFAGWAEAVAGNYDRAKQLCEEAIGVAESQCLDERGWCRVTASAGAVALYRGDPDEGLRLTSRRIEGGKATGDDYELAGGLTLAASIRVGVDQADGFALAGDAVSVARRLGCPTALAYALMTAGMIRIFDAPRDALPYLDEALTTAETVGNQLAMGITLGCISLIHCEHGDWMAAAPYVMKALRNCHRAADLHWVGANLSVVAWIFAGAGEFEAAATIFGSAACHRALAVRGPVTDRLVAAEIAVDAELGPDLVAECHRRGQALEDDDLVALALDGLERLVADG